MHAPEGGQLNDLLQRGELRLSAGRTASAAKAELKEAARTASGTFDVFLSHSVVDADVILGLSNMLERQGLKVYVDWIDDPELDRGSVTASTANRIRQRMDNNSRSLVYATSRAASWSRWMPWESRLLRWHQGRRPDLDLPDRTRLGFTSLASWVSIIPVLRKTLEKVQWAGISHTPHSGFDPPESKRNSSPRSLAATPATPLFQADPLGGGTRQASQRPFGLGGQGRTFISRKAAQMAKSVFFSFSLFPRRLARPAGCQDGCSGGTADPQLAGVGEGQAPRRREHQEVDR